jgi:integrase
MQHKPNAGNARRTKVANHPGIYFRTGASGKRQYEITYLDTSGERRRRWERVEGNLEDAQAALDNVKSRKRRGERVAPTRVTFAEYADAWLETQTQLRPRTREWYDVALRIHLKPRLGTLRLAEMTEDDVLRVIAEMRTAGKKPWTIRGVLTPLGRVLGTAARRGLIASNPVARLERGERPKIEGREMRVLDTGEIERLLGKAPKRYRALLATAVFTGLRQGELLGLTWADVDLEAGLLKVRKQLDRHANRVEPKTRQAVREVGLMPALVKALRVHREAAFGKGMAKATDYVFASETGTPLHYRNVVRRGLDKAAEDAGLIESEAKRKQAKADGQDVRPLRFHDLRHTFASLLIAQGSNVVFVSRQLGHSSPNVTLGVYAHLFDRAEHGQRAKDAMEAAFGNLLARSASGSPGRRGSRVVQRSPAS